METGMDANKAPLIQSSSHDTHNLAHPSRCYRLCPAELQAPGSALAHPS